MCVSTDKMVHLFLQQGSKKHQEENKKNYDMVFY